MTEKQAIDIMYRNENWDFWMEFIRFIGNSYNTFEIDKIRVMFVECAIEAGTIEM